MGDRISELDAATVAALANQFAINEAGTTKRLTLTQVNALILATNKLNAFLSTSSAELAGVISDKTGSGLLVFRSSPTIVTPTIASLTNMQHSHLNAAGGGTITEDAISDLKSYLLNLAEDPSPQLAANLDAQSFDIESVSFYRNSPTTITLSTGALVPIANQTKVAAESGTADTLDNITNTNTSEFDKLYLYADAGDLITVTEDDGTSTAIHLKAGLDIELSETIPLVLRRIGTEWYEIFGPVANFQASATTAKRIPHPVIDSVLEDFAVGHGWTSDATPDVTVSDETTGEFRGLADQSMKLVSDASTTVVHITSPSLTAIDLTQKFLGIWIRFANSNVEDMDDLDLEISSSGNFATDLIRFKLMGGNERGITVRPNDWVLVTAAYSNQETTVGSTDRTAITKMRLRFKDNAVAATMYVGGIVAIKQPPREHIVLAFDDGLEGCYNLAFPKMNEYGYKGITHIIHENMDTAGVLTWDEAKELHDAGWDIGTHGQTSWKTLTLAGLVNYLTTSREAMSAHGITRGVEHSAFPQGDNDAAVRDIVQTYCISCRSTQSFSESNPPSDPMQIKGQVYNSTISTATAQGWIDNAIADGEYLQIYFHEIVSSGATGNQTNQADFDTIIDYLNTNKANVVTMSEYTQSIQDYLRNDPHGVLFLKERAAAEDDVAGRGQLWIKDGTPNKAFFTDDAGTDFQLSTPNKPLVILFAGDFSDNTNGVRYLLIGAPNSWSSTEAHVQLTYNRAMQLNSWTVNLRTNTKDGTTVYAFRDDGVDIDTISFLTGVTGEVNNTGITDDIASGSKLSADFDTSASTTGSQSFHCKAELIIAP